MIKPPRTEVGWQRRYRQTDLAAALVFALAVPARMYGGWLGTAIVLIAGTLLLLIHRERRIERTGTEVRLVDEWWLLGPRRTRRSVVRPVRVALTIPEHGWSARRRTVLLVDGQEGPLVVERWRQPSDRVYAAAVAASLARWFEVELTGMLATSGGMNGPAGWAALRARIGDAAAGGIGGAPLYPAGASKRIGSVALHAAIAAEGTLLLALSRLSFGAHGITAFALAVALPMGALLIAYGLRGALAGRLVTRIGPDGLHVERMGARRELVVHVPFSSVTWIGAPPTKTRVTTLRIGCGDAFVDLTARMLGVTSATFSELCAAYRHALALWLDRHLAEHRPPDRADERSPVPPAGPVFLNDPRLAPDSAVSMLAQTLPRLSILASATFLVAVYLLEWTFSRGAAHVPSNVRFVLPSLVPFLGLKVLGAALGAAAAAIMVALALFLFWCGPAGRFQLVLFLLMLSAPLLLILQGGIYGLQAVDCFDICAGTAQPPQHRITVYKNAMQYGPYEYAAPEGPRAGERAGWLRFVSQEREPLEVRGFWGALYLVAPGDYHATCDSWRARLPSTLRKEGPQ